MYASELKICSLAFKLKGKNINLYKADYDTQLEIEKKNNLEKIKKEEEEIQNFYKNETKDDEKQYLEAGRQDLATECREELDILKTLLPEPVSPEKIYEELWKFGIANDCIYESKLIIPKNKMGIAIKFMKAIFPTADGKMISDVVKEYVG